MPDAAVELVGCRGAAFVHFAGNDSQGTGGGGALLLTIQPTYDYLSRARCYSNHTPREFTSPLHLQGAAHRRCGVPLNGAKRGGATATVSTAASSAQVYS